MHQEYFGKNIARSKIAFSTLRAMFIEYSRNFFWRTGEISVPVGILDAVFVCCKIVKNAKK